jgi:hypothetical protein
MAYGGSNAGMSLDYFNTSGDRLWIDVLRPSYSGIDKARLCPEAATLSPEASSQYGSATRPYYYAGPVGFLDGHAERVGLADLWTLAWSNGWVARVVALP